MLLKEERVRRLHAYIKPENEQSMRAFEKAGFQQQGSAVIRGSRAFHYVRVSEHGHPVS
jgi:RimJ/RimL family protein N-acetyltransferase